MKFYTTTLTTGSLVISTVDGAMMLSVQPSAGAVCTFQGGLPFQQQNSTPITLSNSQVLTVAASSSQSPLDGITITQTTGDIDIIIGF
jgi:hypothetical protein